VRELKASIAGGDIKRLSSISGIGKKIAERIVVELRDKLGAGESLEAVAGAAEKTPEDLRTRDAVLALIALGYKQEEARRMVAAVGVGGARLPTDQIIKKALASPSGPGA